MPRLLPALVGLAAALTVSSAALGQAAPAPSGSASANIQGDQQRWISDPHTHAFYQLAVQAFAQGPDKVDQRAFTEKSYAIFRDFAPTMGVSPEHMVEHLKLIPGQVVQIAKEDPSVLKSYDNFVAAVFGPQ